MSIFREEHLECQFCHKDVPFILYNSINVGIYPELKEKVLNWSLFQYQCPHCQQSDLVCYPVLYHDPENEIMIQVLWKEEDFGQPMEKDLQSLIEVMGQKNYRRREVFGYRELMEKIHIFDTGLSDFAIALLKTIYQMQNPEIQIFFYRKTEDGLAFGQIKGDVSLPDCVIFPDNLYKMALQYAEQWRKPHAFYESLRVDEKYFYKELIEITNLEIPENERSQLVF